jgi:hypothetical protein
MKIFHSTLIPLFASTLVFCAIAHFPVAGVAQDQSKIDNSRLIPKFLPDNQVKMEGTSPDWVKTLIMAEIA